MNIRLNIDVDVLEIGIDVEHPDAVRATELASDLHAVVLSYLNKSFRKWTGGGLLESTSPGEFHFRGHTYPMPPKGPAPGEKRKEEEPS